VVGTISGIPRHVVLVGLMGSGKTTVGELLAERLDRPLIDSDRVIEERTGRTVREIWHTDGEPAYRVLEASALLDALARPEPTVIAAAGGVVLREENRAALRAADALVVWLVADVDVLAERAVHGDHRPLLDDDPRAAMVQMQRDREPLYREVADVVIDTTGRSPDEVANEVLALVTRSRGGATSDVTKAAIRRVRVPLGERSYHVVIGHGAVHELPSLLPSRSRRAAIVTQAAIPFPVNPGIPTERFDIGDGEPSKTLATVETLARGFARMGLTRGDVVIAVGGGVVTDAAGFAAATWHRGVPVLHVPTTLLAMVDAAIGGKTGVNLPEGKNLVGAFWQPVGVICDLDALATLPDRERRSGDGEMAKYHFLTGDDLAAMDLADRVTRCVEIKAEVVAADERESIGAGRRALLNYGHTFAHALEIASGHDLTHGEAVGIGLVYAAELAHRLGRIGPARVDEHRKVVGDTYGLPTTLPEGVDHDDLVALMGRDKKAVDGLTFVLDGPTGVEVVAGVPEPEVRVALHAVAAG
jgi:5-deoxy-5-amino-3-dehydroquinate synthase